MVNLYPWRAARRRRRHTLLVIVAFFLAALIAGVYLRFIPENKPVVVIPVPLHTEILAKPASTQLRLIGYIQQGQQQVALVMLPNKKILTVKKGSVLNNGAKVIKLSATGLSLECLNKKIVLIR